MKIKEILKNVETLGNTPQGEVSQICCDSRKCTAGSLFVAVRGAEADGHAFIGKAIENGTEKAFDGENDPG